METVKIILFCLAVYIGSILIIKISNKICNKLVGETITDFSEESEVVLCFIPLANSALSVFYLGITLFALIVEGLSKANGEKGSFKGKVRKLLS